jgi:hypothetical protein
MGWLLHTMRRRIDERLRSASCGEFHGGISLHLSLFASPFSMPLSISPGDA